MCVCGGLEILPLSVMDREKEKVKTKNRERKERYRHSVKLTI